LAFPLRNRAVDAATIRERVEEVAAMLDLTPDLQRRAHGLTADAKQKISLGRGLVRNDVAAVLFDEPLTVIDPQLKFELRRKLKEVHEQFNLTFIYVTHDQNEALTIADQVVLMNEGTVVQVGTPQELFENPRHTFVGYFIGSPGMNLVPCTVEGGAAVINGQRIPLGEAVAEKAQASAGSLELGIRPEFLRMVPAGTEGAVSVTVFAVEDLGNFKMVEARLGEHAIKVKLSEDQEVQGETVSLAFPPERTKIYENGRLIE
jgi:glycerol transport system ATP-binding protein